MSDERKKGFVMYWSFIDSISALPADDFKECILALKDYARDGIEYEGDNGIVKMYITLIKPQIDANNARYENGKKGGRPPVEKPEEPLAEVEAIVLNDGSEWKPTVSQLEEYQRLYPNVNIQQEFRNMRGWCIGNPTKRKTRKGASRFVSGWLSRVQDKGGHRVPTVVEMPVPNYIQNQISGAPHISKPATAETLEKVRKLQGEMND